MGMTFEYDEVPAELADAGGSDARVHGRSCR